jgi:hypothetical protein
MKRLLTLTALSLGLVGFGMLSTAEAGPGPGRGFNRGYGHSGYYGGYRGGWGGPARYRGPVYRPYYPRPYVYAPPVYAPPVYGNGVILQTPGFGFSFVR